MAENRVNWEMIGGMCHTHGAEGAAVYGVRVKGADGTLWEWQDVHVSRQAVQALVRRLQEAQPEPCHYAEMVEEFIQEQSMGEF